MSKPRTVCYLTNIQIHCDEHSKIWPALNDNSSSSWPAWSYRALTSTPWLSSTSSFCSQSSPNGFCTWPEAAALLLWLYTTQQHGTVESSAYLTSVTKPSITIDNTSIHEQRIDQSHIGKLWQYQNTHNSKQHKGTIQHAILTGSYCCYEAHLC